MTAALTARAPNVTAVMAKGKRRTGVLPGLGGAMNTRSWCSGRSKGTHHARRMFLDRASSKPEAGFRVPALGFTPKVETADETFVDDARGGIFRDAGCAGAARRDERRRGSTARGAFACGAALGRGLGGRNGSRLPSRHLQRGGGPLAARNRTPLQTAD